MFVQENKIRDTILQKKQEPPLIFVYSTFHNLSNCQTVLSLAYGVDLNGKKNVSL